MMESALTATRRTRTLGARWSLDPSSLGAWLLPAALVTYLGMRSGGYDMVIGDQVGIDIGSEETQPTAHGVHLDVRKCDRMARDRGQVRRPAGQLQELVDQ